MNENDKNGQPDSFNNGAIAICPIVFSTNNELNSMRKYRLQ